MKKFTHEELMEMLPAYALGALSRDETAAVDAAMSQGTADGEVLRKELLAYQDVSVAIATTKAVAPPPGARDRLMARIANGKSVSMTAPRVRRTPAWMPGALAASLVVAAGLGVYGARLRRETVDLRAKTVALQLKLDGREHTLNSILEADEHLRVATVLSADASQGGPGIQFYWNEKQRRGVVHAFRMKPAPAGRNYQVWVLQDGKPVSVSVFNSDPDGHALVDRLTLPESSRGASLVLVTEEPEGGSPGPTTTPFMRGELGPRP